jgi:hypothetical protein
MRDTRTVRNLVLFGFLILWCFIPAPGYSGPQQTNPSPTSVKPAQPPGVQQVPFLVRGTVMTNYGKGVQDIEVSLLQMVEGGRPLPIDKKNTDSAGRYGFTVLPDKKGKQLRVVPRLLQPCPTGSFSFEPVAKEFTLQNSMTADFRLNLSPPDTAISLVLMGEGVQNMMVYFEFEIKNKGCLASAKSSVQFSIATPCSPEQVSMEKAVPVIPGQGSTKVLFETHKNNGGRGCAFTATLSPQPYEVRTEDNKIIGTSPKLNLLPVNNPPL